jgi:hypothetical protein
MDHSSFLATAHYLSTFSYVTGVECSAMSPFSVTVQNVPDRVLGPLLTREGSVSGSVLCSLPGLPLYTAKLET